MKHFANISPTDPTAVVKHRVGEADALIASLQKKIDIVRNRMATGTTANWMHVGDISNVVMRLEEIDASWETP